MKILAVAALPLLLLACQSEKTIETAEENETLKNYGPYEVQKSEAIPVSEMLTDFAGKTGEETYTFVGKIDEVCTKMGCWVNVDKGNGETFMVRFKDHFTIPTDTELGSMAYLHGTAYMDTISVDMQKHFMEDGGKSEEEIAQVTEPKYELAFEADGILVESKQKKQRTTQK